MKFYVHLATRKRKGHKLLNDKYITFYRSNANIAELC